MEFAIVDIETTGSYASGSGITEIAIRIFDGQQVIDRYDSLIKPAYVIPRYITALTGIDNEMVAESPPFEEVAATVHDLLAGRVFVAHNVYFDYGFLKHQLAAAGYTFNATKLCTVRLSRKIKPGLPSYSLGKLCESLDIRLEDRHRAAGDVDATVELFRRLLQWDDRGIISAMLKKGASEQQLPPRLPKADFEALPDQPGVYYFQNNSGKVIYVGKAKNLRKRVAQHFSGSNPSSQRQGFMRDICGIQFEVCGTELMAFILEALEIKRIWPKYNRALKNYEPKFGLFVYEDLMGYKRLFIGKFNKSHLPIQVFTTREGGINRLYELVRRFSLCASLCRLGCCERCEAINKRKDLLCTAAEGAAAYNARVDQALDYLATDRPGFYIVDKGRDDTEKSCIWVEAGNFYGMGYIANDLDIRSLEEVKSALTAYRGNHYIMQLILSYMCKHPRKVIQLERRVAVDASPDYFSDSFFQAEE